MAKKAKAPEVATPSPSKEAKDGSDHDWEADGALSDIERAMKHMQDPEMMKRVHKKVGRKVKALQGIRSIKDLKEVAYNVRSKPDSDE